MRIIPRFLHGVLDYILGVLLFLIPALFEFLNVEPARNIFWILGGLTLLYSLLTAYELGVVNLIPFRGHLILDILGGCVLGASPWLFGFSERVFAPHVVVGLFEIMVGLSTRLFPAPDPIATSR